MVGKGCCQLAWTFPIAALPGPAGLGSSSRAWPLRPERTLRAAQISLQLLETRALSPCPPGLCPRLAQMFRPGHVPAP